MIQQCLTDPRAPQFEIVTLSLGSPEYDATSLSLSMTSKPIITSPNTTCLPSRCGHGTKVIKNWQPFVLGPQLAIERRLGLSCLT